MALRWLVDVPTEIRLHTYKALFKSLTVVHVGKATSTDDFRQQAVESVPLNLSLTAKLVKQEIDPIFWSLSLFRYEVNSPKTGKNIQLGHLVRSGIFQRIRHLDLALSRDMLPSMQNLNVALDILKRIPATRMEYLSVECVLSKYAHHKDICSIVDMSIGRVKVLNFRFSFMTRELYLSIIDSGDEYAQSVAQDFQTAPLARNIEHSKKMIKKAYDEPQVHDSRHLEVTNIDELTFEARITNCSK